MQSIPIRLDLTTVTSAGPPPEGGEALVLSMKVDAFTDLQQVYQRLIASPDWPASVNCDERAAAVMRLIGHEDLDRNECPFPDAHPPMTPSGYTVRRHPDTRDQWFVIDKDYDIPGAAKSRGEAILEAWHIALERGEANNLPEAHRAYFSATLDLPEGYRVRQLTERARGWAWENMENMTGQCDYATAFEAKVAAWRHYRGNRRPLEWEDGYNGPTMPGETWEAHIDHPSTGRKGRVVVYGDTRAEALSLRDRILAALND